MKDAIREHVIGKRHYRSMKVDREKLSMESETIHMTFSSDYPVARWWGVEVLSHKPECMRLERWRAGAPYLMDHKMSDQRGIILDGDFRAPFLDGNVKYSANDPGQALKRDVIDGIRPYTSVGYEIHHLREMMPEEMTEEMKDLCLQYGIKCYEADDWEPFEGSSVALGANPGVGTRSIEYRDGLDEEKITELLKVASEERSHNNPTPSITTQERGHAMPEPKTKEQREQEEAERVRDIEAIGKKFESRIGGKEKMDQLVKDAIELQRSVELFRGDIYMRVNDGKPLETPTSFLDLPNSDKRDYSITKALRYMVDGVGGDLERECSAAIEKRALVGGGVAGAPRNGGLYVPYDIQGRELMLGHDIHPAVRRELDAVLAKYNRRDLAVGTGSAGGYLVGTQHRPADMIELLRNALIQGITYLPGLSSNIDIPKQTGGATITVAANEGADFTETAPVYGQITLSPHDIGGYVEISRRLLIQANPAVDALVSADLIQQLGLKMNYLALYGSGAAGEPLGAFNTPNIGTFNGASLTWTQLLESISDIGTANVTGALQYLMNSTVKVLLMGREKAVGYPNYLMNEDTGMVAGYGTQVSEQMGSGHLALVKPSEIIMAEFGMMELNYDRNTKSASGGLRIAIYNSMDSALRHPGAITFADNIS